MRASGGLRAIIASGMMLLAANARAVAEDVTPEDKEAVIDYCLNISDKAAESRMARQVEQLKQLEGEIGLKLSELEKRQTELQAWVERQEQIQAAASAGIVEIYAAMDPEAAAQQMATIDSKLASSVLRQLKPKQASLILNEMKPDQAALLVKSIAAASKELKSK